MKIAIFGLGFVGLTTAVGFANKLKWAKVCGYEIDNKKIEMLENHRIPFFEEGLLDAMQTALANNLELTNNQEHALSEAKIIFYCIGTPMGEDGSADLSYLLNALKSTAKHIKKCSPCPILVIKSTIPPSSLKEVFLPFLQDLGLKNNYDFSLANNPEFLREGFAYSDFMHPDRIIIGSERKIKEIEAIYSPFNAPILFVSPNTAEFIKYLSNTTLSMMISYANEMSIIAHHIGDIDIKRAFEILHLDKRFYGNPANIISYLYPGMGFGGYCLPKDTLALYKKSSDYGFKSRILEDILEVNKNIIDFHITNILKQNKEAKIGVLGLSFKPNSDDVRDCKSAILIEKLLNVGFKNIFAYDPIANESFKNTYSFNINYIDSLDMILQICDVFIIATAWDEFKQIQDRIPHKKIYNLRYI